jgi:hypothetical protein
MPVHGDTAKAEQVYANTLALFAEDIAETVGWLLSWTGAYERDVSREASSCVNNAFVCVTSQCHAIGKERGFLYSRV